MRLVRLRVKVPPVFAVNSGEDITAAICEAVEIALVFDGPVRLIFNDTEFMVYPTAHRAALAALEAAK